MFDLVGAKKTINSAGITRDKVLQSLKEARGAVSGQQLADDLAISRSALWKHIEKLREQGCRIEGSPRIGYRLIGLPDMIFLSRLTTILPKAFRGNIELLVETGSTNDVAKEGAVAGRFKPAGLVAAERQSAGRGRFGRPWSSPNGGVWMSVVVRPEIPVGEAAMIPTLAAVVAAEAIGASAGVEALIKWPNDILIKGRKVAGILTELAAEMGKIEYVVVGIGINANFPADRLDGLFAAGAVQAAEPTTLLDETGEAIDRNAMIGEIATGIWSGLPLPPKRFEDVLKRYRDLSATLGKEVSVRSGGDTFVGKAENYDGLGGLVIKTKDGKRKVFRAGEVTLREE